jgi:hypothetical protein
VEPDDSDAFFSIVRNGAPLTETEAQKLAELVLPLYQRAQSADDDVRPSSGASAMTADDVVQVWAGAARDQSTTTSETDDDGFTTGPSNATSASPRSAGLLQKLDPRNIVRTLTVYQMKDRAATIGARGLGPLTDASGRI